MWLLTFTVSILSVPYWVALDGSRATAITCQPLASARPTAWDPTPPVAPITTTFIRGHVSSALESASATVSACICEMDGLPWAILKIRMAGCSLFT